MTDLRKEVFEFGKHLNEVYAAALRKHNDRRANFFLDIDFVADEIEYDKGEKATASCPADPEYFDILEAHLELNGERVKSLEHLVELIKLNYFDEIIAQLRG